MEVIVTSCCKLVYNPFRDLQLTYIGVIIHLLSTMDILVRWLAKRIFPKMVVKNGDESHGRKYNITFNKHKFSLRMEKSDSI